MGSLPFTIQNKESTEKPIASSSDKNDPTYLFPLYGMTVVLT